MKGRSRRNAERSADAADAGIRRARDCHECLHRLQQCGAGRVRKLVEKRGAAAFYGLKAEFNAAADKLAQGRGKPFDPRASA